MFYFKRLRVSKETAYEATRTLCPDYPGELYPPELGPVGPPVPLPTYGVAQM